MLYNEFIEGTGCRDNDYNYQVYKDLEVMYMNSNLSKQDIYNYGKKLVNNCKSEEAIKLETEIKESIAAYRQEVKEAKARIENLKEDLARADGETIQYWLKNQIKWERERMKEARSRARELKWLLQD